MIETPKQFFARHHIGFEPAGDGSVAGLSANLPIVVSYGLGVDSTAVLVGLWKRGIKPDLILFADTGSEKDQTYAYLDVINRWLESVGFPTVTVVRYEPKKFKHAPYSTLEGNCISNKTLPSLTFGYKSCSLKWKAAPMDKYVEKQSFAREVWADGQKVQRLIGYDCSTADNKRFAHAQGKVDEKYAYIYPLQSWGMKREDCIALIAEAGLPVPPKSSCFFCPAMKPHEVSALDKDKLRRIVAIEANAKPKLGVVEGLWRTSTKTRPGAMTEYIRRENLLSEEEVNSIFQKTLLTN